MVAAAIAVTSTPTTVTSRVSLPSSAMRCAVHVARSTRIASARSMVRGCSAHHRPHVDVEVIDLPYPGHTDNLSLVGSLDSFESASSARNCSPSTSTFGTNRSSHEGNHHALEPNRDMTAGTTVIRITKASNRTANESPSPICMMKRRRRR